MAEEERPPMRLGGGERAVLAMDEELNDEDLGELVAVIINLLAENLQSWTSSLSAKTIVESRLAELCSCHSANRHELALKVRDELHELANRGFVVVSGDCVAVLQPFIQLVLPYLPTRRKT